MKTIHCENCVYRNSSIKLPYIGQKTSKILLVVDAPNKEDIQQKKPLSGKAATLILKLLQETELTQSDVAVAPVLRCQITDEKNTKEINTALKSCKQYIKDLADIINPKLIVAFGALPLKSLLGKQKILENRGKFFDSPLGKVFVTVGLDYVLKGSHKNYPNIDFNLMSQKEKIIFEDFTLIKKYLNNGYNIPLINTLSFKEATAKDLEAIQNAKAVALDFETSSGGLFNCRALSLAFSIDSNNSYVCLLDNPDLKDEISKILTNDKIIKIVASRPFDETVAKLKLNTTIKGLIFDVLTMAHLFDENGFSYSLETIANLYTDLKNIKVLSQNMRSNLENADKKTLIEYNGVDSSATYQAFKYLYKQLKQDKLVYRYLLKFMLPVQDLFSKIYLHGIPIDTAKLKENKRIASDFTDELHETAVSYLPKEIINAHRDKGISLTRSEIISDYLFTHPQGLQQKAVYFTEKTKQPKTDDAHLKIFKDIPFVSHVLKWKKAKKIQSTYFSQIEKAIQADGKIYPNTLFTQTVTGRLVMLNPAIMTIPQQGEFANWIKEVFIADDGWLLCSRDLSQSELRIAGWLANDQNILQALHNNIDLHIKTASIVNKIDISEVNSDMRQKAKAINFGFIFGQSPEGFKKYAKDIYNIDFTLKEAEYFKDAFFAKPHGYFRIKVYHNYITNFVIEHGYVQSILGRKRRLPNIYSKSYFEKGEAIRQAINFGIQSFSNELGLISMFLMQKKIEEAELENKIKLLWFIHDNIMLTAEENYIEVANSMLANCMEKESKVYIKKEFGIDVGYPIESDSKIGKSWASLKKV
jgi:DNA polymerase-1